MSNHPQNVSLSRELSDYVRKLVQDGAYVSVSEVVREALRAHKERRDWDTKLHRRSNEG